jgi:hypothetical protein
VTDKVVYRSTHPDVLAAYHAIQDDYRDFVAWMRSVVAEHDPTGERHPISVKGSACLWFVGMSHEDGQPIPDGWRRSAKTGYLVPDRRRAAGKRLAQTMESRSQKFSPAERIEAAGMPGILWGPSRFFTGGFDLLEDDAAVYAPWSGEAEPLLDGKVDLGRWERVPLSRYYAAVEARDAAAAEST